MLPKNLILQLDFKVKLIWPTNFPLQDFSSLLLMVDAYNSTKEPKNFANVISIIEGKLTRN